MLLYRIDKNFAMKEEGIVMLRIVRSSQQLIARKAEKQAPARWLLAVVEWLSTATVTETNLVVRQTSSGENWDLLTTGNTGK